MSTWIAIALVGIGSYALRVTPLLIAGRMRLGERTQLILRYAGIGGMAALLVSALTPPATAGGGHRVPQLVAVVTCAVVAVRGRSMTRSLVAGAVGFLVAGGAVALLG
ncbi:AzlD domain-containing protein [Nakamurella multipartita]|uniref:Branched-chain amino acid transport n=1 Tax=Nakamurella multipartita (strain ATCC 700099 / DSM 44233 / CIP 104796 / JCM 9543 / NBRC 105858 / Y-104) TaxID=479431 RepID=C8X7L3_NAKMY|nr:AzlD domain-containing protein [Nakamurella multipartita]ACV78966.1 branched-chain amino acid transport [Nakamurella multipartita DSM 44233]